MTGNTSVEPSFLLENFTSCQTVNNLPLQALRLNQLRILDLREASCTRTEATLLSEVILQASSLEELDLSYNLFGLFLFPLFSQILFLFPSFLCSIDVRDLHSILTSLLIAIQSFLQAPSLLFCSDCFVLDQLLPSLC